MSVQTINIQNYRTALGRYWTIQNFSRFAIFVVYFWFGALKVLDQSPASDLVKALHDMVIPFLDFRTFFMLFGVFEMVVGALFLIPGLTKYAKLIFFGHIATTILPLLILPAMVWTGFLVPTIEGQYIIKNLVLIALVLNID